MSVRKTTVLCCVCLLLAVGAVAVLFPCGVFSPPPSYDYREEQFTGSQDWQAYLQLDGVDPDNPPAFPVHHYDQAVKQFIIDKGSFYRAVREGTLRNLLQDSDRYEWVFPRSYHGSAEDVYRLRHYDGVYSIREVPSPDDPGTGYTFIQLDVVASLLKQAGLDHPDFIAAFTSTYFESARESYLYVEQDGKPFIAVSTPAPDAYPGLETSISFYPYAEFQKVIQKQCDWELEFYRFALDISPDAVTMDWYINYFNGYYPERRMMRELLPHHADEVTS